MTEQRGHEDDRHRHQQSAALPPVADHAPEREHQGDRQNELAPVLQDVRPDARVLERMRGIGVEEAAAVVADQFDRFLAGDRPQGDDLLCAFERRRFDRGAQRLRNAERREGERDDDRQRHEHIERRARHIDPEIADGWRFPPRQRSRQRDRHRGRRRRIEEVVGRQADHLRKVAECRLAGVSLPVGVGDEADRDVEGEVGRHARKALRVERQIGLQSQQGVEAQHAGAAERTPSRSHTRTTSARPQGRPRPHDRARARGGR